MVAIEILARIAMDEHTIPVDDMRANLAYLRVDPAFEVGHLGDGKCQ